MFPASAGMNRVISCRSGETADVPRERGDEPQLIHGNGTAPQMFPASAGMNRSRVPSPQQSPHVPRERGDEPSKATSPCLGW